MKINKLVAIPVILLILVLLIFAGMSLLEGTSFSSDYSYSLKSPEKFDLNAPSLDRGTNEQAGKGISQERKIISTANLQLEVNSVQTTITKITNITLELEGFISSSSIYGYGAQKTGQVTLRIPQKNFHIALGQLEALGTVKSRDLKGQDVTEEFIDLGARLDNLKKQETRLQEILKIANTVKDVLEVEKELGRVRGEIESYTGKLNYLNQSIEMSTITVKAAEPEPITGDNWGIAESLRDAVRAFFDTINGLIVFTGFIIPILIYLIIVILIGLGIKRKVLPLLLGK